MIVREPAIASRAVPAQRVGRREADDAGPDDGDVGRVGHVGEVTGRRRGKYDRQRLSNEWNGCVASASGAGHDVPQRPSLAGGTPMTTGRLTTPLVRDNGELRPASWDEALDRVAEGFGRARANSDTTTSFGMFSCSKAS